VRLVPTRRARRPRSRAYRPSAWCIAWTRAASAACRCSFPTRAPPWILPPLLPSPLAAGTVPASPPPSINAGPQTLTDYLEAAGECTAQPRREWLSRIMVTRHARKGISASIQARSSVAHEQEARHVRLRRTRLIRTYGGPTRESVKGARRRGAPVVEQPCQVAEGTRGCVVLQRLGGAT
jgi:hypothetical protein